MSYKISFSPTYLLTYVHLMKTELAHSRCRGMKKKSLQKSEEQILGISR